MASAVLGVFSRHCWDRQQIISIEDGLLLLAWMHFFLCSLGLDHKTAGPQIGTGHIVLPCNRSPDKHRRQNTHYTHTGLMNQSLYTEEQAVPRPGRVLVGNH